MAVISFVCYYGNKELIALLQCNTDIQKIEETFEVFMILFDEKAIGCTLCQLRMGICDTKYEISYLKITFLIGRLEKNDTIKEVKQKL